VRPPRRPALDMTQPKVQAAEREDNPPTFRRSDLSVNDMVDYSISRVRYEPGGRQVQRVQAHIEPSHFVLGELARRQVVESIKRGARWVTVLQNGVDWRREAEVHVVPVGGREFLRIDREEVEEDDLGELPEL